MNTLLEARNLVKCYGDRVVVKDIDLVVLPGEVVALIGPNGAGKSTTLEMVLGLRMPDSGEITYWRKDPLRYIGVQLQSTPFFLARCGLTEVARTEAARLSSGQQKRLAIALTLSHQPRLIFLDEPTAALDPRARHEIRELIRSLATTGTTIVFTSHDMEEVGKLADRIVLVVEGHIRAEGKPTDLLATYHVDSLEDLYLNLTNEEL